MSSYSSYSSSSSDPGAFIISDYCPFIADVPIESTGDPFPIAIPDTRSDDEIQVKVFQLRKFINATRFTPPLPLSDFCLIATKRWEEEEEAEKECAVKCNLI